MATWHGPWSNPARAPQFVGMHPAMIPLIQGFVAQQAPLRSAVLEIDDELGAARVPTGALQHFSRRLQSHLRVCREVVFPTLERMARERGLLVIAERVRVFAIELASIEPMLAATLCRLEQQAALEPVAAQWAELRRAVLGLLDEEREMLGLLEPGTVVTSDRRKTRRVPCDGAAAVLRPWKLPGRLVDVSVEGACLLLTSLPPAVGTEVLAELTLPTQPLPLVLRAEVRNVRRHQGSDRRCEVGLKFVGVKALLGHALSRYVELSP